jgi:L-arabinose isomerase
MIDLKKLEAWFVTGSQDLYGPETLKKVAEHSQEIVKSLNASEDIPVKIVYKPVVTTPDEITAVCVAANSASECIGLITWMHTFSPAKMWIAGLYQLNKPFVHLHTQFNRDIPWADIDMDFMNLNQSAHGDREFGFIGSRLRKERKVIVGHWMDPEVRSQISAWLRVAAGWHESRKTKIARFGDNMREVAVTEGDKVEAQKVFGWSVNGYGTGELVQYINQVTDSQIDKLIQEYESEYKMKETLKKGGEKYNSLKEAARIESGLRVFLEEGGFGGFTDTFQDLFGMVQLPGIAVQRLMKDGYGFGAEGDWKMAAMLHVMKVMSSGLPGGNSFMEDYTYHLDPAGMRVLGAHMLEICASIADGKPSCEIHPLSIGGKDAPVRLVFNVPSGPAINVSVLDMGNRFRILVNDVEAVQPPKPLPKLPTARVLWDPKPDLKTAAAAWILAGGAHHTCFSQNLTSGHIMDFAEMAGVEFLVIDKDTCLHEFKNTIRWNEVYYHLAKGI